MRCLRVLCCAACTGSWPCWRCSRVAQCRCLPRLLFADVAACCVVVLPLLAGTAGLGSSVTEVRAVAADVTATALKTAGAAQVRGRGIKW